MKTNVTTSPRLDMIDRDRFQKMFASKEFMIYEARIRGELARASLACQRVGNPMPEVRAAQGAAMALRAVLELKQMIVNEIAAKQPR